MEKEFERYAPSRDLIKSKKRVDDHGEVFTPSWLVEAMLDLTGESDRLNARFLEPACGDGNFLVRVLRRKLAVAEAKSRKATNDKRYMALIAAMSIYGIELLEDNIIECRKRLLNIFASSLNVDSKDQFYRTASFIFSLNIVHGDALKMTTKDGRPIVFSEWEYLGQGKFQRRDFRFDLIARPAAGQGKLVLPCRIYEPLSVEQILRPPHIIVNEATL